MKERIVGFGEAIIAIIIPIMVLELPIKLLAGGGVDFAALSKSVGIYFISFLFVANLWFQLTYGFIGMETIKNRVVLHYLLLLFFLSLVPSATRLLIDDTSRQTILIYGVLTLVVSALLQLLLYAMYQSRQNSEQKTRRIVELKWQSLISLLFRLGLLVFSYFFLQPALLVYLLLPILAFLQNIVDREEDQFVASLDQTEQADYLKDRNALWGNHARRYGALLRDSLSDSSDSNQWQDLLAQWEHKVEHEIKQKQKLLNQAHDPRQQSRLDYELQGLLLQQKRLRQRQAGLKQENGRTRRESQLNKKG